MYLFILITGIVLFPQAYTLKCWEGEDSTMSSKTEKICTAEFTRCGSIRITSFNGNLKVPDSMFGSCVKADDCIQGSLNIGIFKSVTTSKCCDTDNCNTELAPDAPKTNPNGKKCFRCDGQADCSGTLNCEGDENFCVSTKLGTLKAKGCATKSMCSMASPELQGYAELKCCEGDFCNSSSGTSASLLLLATVLISLFFLSN